VDRMSEFVVLFAAMQIIVHNWHYVPVEAGVIKKRTVLVQNSPLLCDCNIGPYRNSAYTDMWVLLP
jgi:hypothetical protein